MRVAALAHWHVSYACCRSWLSLTILFCSPKSLFPLIDFFKCRQDPRRQAQARASASEHLQEIRKGMWRHDWCCPCPQSSCGSALNLWGHGPRKCQEKIPPFSPWRQRQFHGGRLRQGTQGMVWWRQWWWLRLHLRQPVYMGRDLRLRRQLLKRFCRLCRSRGFSLHPFVHWECFWLFPAISWCMLHLRLLLPSLLLQWL